VVKSSFDMSESRTRLDKKSARPRFLLPAGGVEVSGDVTAFRWPRAEDYIVDDGVITVPEGAGFKAHTMPLEDRDLFGSLARLSKDGEPSEAKALRWCREHGVFFREENIGGDPLPLETFREESRRAREALTLYFALRNRRAHLVRPRIDIRPESKGPFGAAHVDGLDARHMVWRGEADQLPDDVVLSIGLSALEARVQERVDLTATMAPDFGHERPLGDLYRPVPLLMPRGLLGAAWLQFWIFVSDFDRYWRLCANPACGLPFLVERSDQTTCPGSEACRKGRQRAGR
jgi:hypothetical protein